MEQSRKTELKESIIEALKDVKTSRCVEDILEEGAWKKGLHPESEELSKVFNELIKENKVVVHILWDGYDYHLHFGPAK